MKKFSVSNIIIGCLIAVILISSGYAVYKYRTVDKGMIGSEADMLESYKNINVMLTRPDNWHKINSKTIISSYAEFAGIDGSTATVPITAELARQFCNADDDEISHYAAHNTTDVAYENLIYGRENRVSWSVYVQNSNDGSYKDYSYSNRVRLVFATPPSEDEYAMAEKENITLEAEPVALDGFVFITHKDNPVDSLTVEQIQDIYSGKITNWKDVGGKDEKIRAFQRTKNSGSQTAMEELVMKGKKLADPPIAFVSEGMGDLVDAVAEYENETAAIGYTYYYYLNNLYKNPDIKVLNIDGISPENENLVSKKYPFSTAYYAVMSSSEPEGSVYRKLRDYLLSDEGQEIIRLAGYCPVNG